MKIIFVLLLLFIETTSIFCQQKASTKQEVKPPSLRIIEDAWIKLEKNGKPIDSVKSKGYINYYFSEFDTVNGYVRISFPNSREWIPRGKGYLTMNDIEPENYKEILAYYALSSGDSTHLLKYSKIYDKRLSWYKNLMEQKEKDKKAAVENKRKERLKDLTKKFGKTNANLIIEKKIRIGMIKEMVIESWGEPDDINRTVTANTDYEQWVYGENYVYFENGILTGWQD